MNEAGQVAGSISVKNGLKPAFWMPDGSFGFLYSEGGGNEATGISEPGGGLVIGGSSFNTAVRWRP